MPPRGCGGGQGACTSAHGTNESPPTAAAMAPPGDPPARGRGGGRWRQHGAVDATGGGGGGAAGQVGVAATNTPRGRWGRGRLQQSAANRSRASGAGGSLGALIMRRVGAGQGTSASHCAARHRRIACGRPAGTLPPWATGDEAQPVCGGLGTKAPCHAGRMLHRFPGGTCCRAAHGRCAGAADSPAHLHICTSEHLRYRGLILLLQYPTQPAMRQ